MNTTDTPAPAPRPPGPPAAPSTTTEQPPRIDSRSSFHAGLRWGLDAAVAHGARRIICCDGEFAAWSPLNEPAVLQALTTWLRRPQRRLVLLACHYDELPRRWPRFAAWRRDWLHAVDAWLPPPELATALPTVLVADHGVSVELTDRVHWRGHASLDERRAHQLLQQVDAVLQRSGAGFAANVLGL